MADLLKSEDVMLKLFKELWQSLKGGLQEGREELAQEAAKEAADNRQAGEDDQKAIQQVPYDEQFGTALGTPFRIIIFGDWFTLFNFTDDDERYPLHLYSFGDYPQLMKHRDEFAKLLKRDFDIVDWESCCNVLGAYFDLVDLEKADSVLAGHQETIDLMMWRRSKPGADALIAAVVSYISTSATDAGYLNKSEAIVILQRIQQFIKASYASWEIFGDAFLEGEKNVGLNNKMGAAVLKKYLGYLKSKKGSPWNNVPWAAGSAELDVSSVVD